MHWKADFLVFGCLELDPSTYLFNFGRCPVHETHSHHQSGCPGSPRRT